ncbi:hypothetical protein BDF19DRAFT_415584 [Syncephalis fuscata]|nr:hypothetical protein BDF19DRAFT_415584 [Syncephalis fuscata]
MYTSIKNVSLSAALIVAVALVSSNCVLADAPANAAYVNPNGPGAPVVYVPAPSITPPVIDYTPAPAPVAPVVPVAPVAPVAPVVPVAPVAPVAPAPEQTSAPAATTTTTTTTTSSPSPTSSSGASSLTGPNILEAAALGAVAYLGQALF